MTDEKKKKKKPAASHPPSDDGLQRTPFERVGDVLRAAREERGLTIADVSAAINIRGVQLRAIEEGHIEALPEMIYAQGFVKSYANFLHLDGAEMTARFKAEHAGNLLERPELHFPEPLQEDKLPSAIIIGVAAVIAAMVLVGWVIFTGEDKKSAEIAATIPEAPVIQTEVSSLPVDPSATLPPATPVDMLPPETPAAPETADSAPAIPAETPVAEEPVAVAETPAPAPELVAAPAETPAAVETTETPVAAETAAALPVEPVPEPIEIKPKGRIVLQAAQTSWVQISDSRNRVILKKVLKPGEKFHVPDQGGLSMMTSNAGGLDVYVDGKKVNPLGLSGDIIRGIPLEPESLKKRRTSRVRNY